MEQKKRWVKTTYDYEKHVLHAFVIFIAPETTVWKLKRILNMCALYLCFKTLSFQIIGFCRTNGVYPLCALLIMGLKCLLNNPSLFIWDKEAQ